MATGGDQTDSDRILSKVLSAYDALLDSREATPTPMIPGLLDRETARIPEEEPPVVSGNPHLGGQRYDTRAYPGANLLHDVDLLRTLIGLDEAAEGGLLDPDRVAGYETAALSYLTYFANHCADETTGLWPWGHHAFWHFEERAPAALQRNYITGEPRAEGGGMHNQWRPAPRWLLEVLDVLNPGCIRRLADGLDYHWKLDTPTGVEYNRHAKLFTTDRGNPTNKGKGGPSVDIASESGFLLLDWAMAYRRDRDEWTFRQLSQMAEYWWHRRDPEERGLLPVESRGDRPMFSNTLNTGQTIHVAAAMLDAAAVLEGIEPRLVDRIRDHATTYADGVLAAPHDYEAGDFVKRLPRGDPTAIGDEVPRIRFADRIGADGTVEGQPRDRDDAVHFGGDYGFYHGIAAGTPYEIAEHCLRVYRHTGDERFLDFARAVGETRHGASLPEHPRCWADDAASQLCLIADLYAETGAEAWLDTGLSLADDALDTYFDDAPLPRGAPALDAYDSQLGVGRLLHGLTRLALLDRSQVDCPLPARLDHTDTLDYRY